MSLTQTSVQLEGVVDFLRRRSDADLGSVRAIGEGQTSQAFAFRAGTGDYVLRISAERDPLDKERYAATHFASAAVPIPRVREIGAWDASSWYAISDLSRGTVLAKLGDAAFQRLLPAFLGLLDAIHATPLAPRERCGWWEGDGEAQDATWRGYILSVANTERYLWPSVTESGRADGALLAEAFAAIARLVEGCPERAELIHGDFGLHNVISDGETITGVIDWENSKFGDPLYDVAWVEFWSPAFRFPDLYTRRCRDRGLDVHDYDARIHCYALHVALEMLYVHALSGQDDMVARTSGRLRELLSP